MVLTFLSGAHGANADRYRKLASQVESGAAEFLGKVVCCGRDSHPPQGRLPHEWSRTVATDRVSVFRVVRCPYKSYCDARGLVLYPLDLNNIPYVRVESGGDLSLRCV